MTSLSDASLAHLREVADRPDLTGTRYELMETLGRGGMGAIYRVFDQELQRSVALKVLNDPEPDPAVVTRLLAEARVIAGLEHPGIVPVHEVGTLPDGRVFYTMKLVAGTRLDSLTRAGMTLQERLRIFERVCETVAFAHAHGVVHLDLKPENVMVGSFGEVLVMDWGLAMRKADPPRTMFGGTPGYIAPERSPGQPADERHDVYSLGALLSFLLGESGPPGPKQAELPRALESIRLRALARDPAARYPSVIELSADIARFLDGERVLAHRETAWERVGRFVHRFRTPIALIVAYLVMRLVLLVISRS